MTLYVCVDHERQDSHDCDILVSVVQEQRHLEKCLAMTRHITTRPALSPLLVIIMLVVTTVSIHLLIILATMARTKRSKAVLSDSTNTSTTKKSRVSSWHHEENSIWDKLQVVLEKLVKAVNDAKKNDTIHYSIDPEVEKLCEEIRQSLLELKADPKQEWTPLSKKDRAKLNKLKQVFDDMVEE